MPETPAVLEKFVTKTFPLSGLAEHQVASSQSQLTELPGHRGLCWSVYPQPTQSGPQWVAVFPHRDHDKVRVCCIVKCRGKKTDHGGREIFRKKKVRHLFWKQTNKWHIALQHAKQRNPKKERERPLLFQSSHICSLSARLASLNWPIRSALQKERSARLITNQLFITVCSHWQSLILFLNMLSKILQI